MHRIDSSGATADNRFTDGNKTLGIPATIVDAAWMNSVQEELVNLLAQAGIAPDKATTTQLFTALGSLFLKNADAVSAATANKAIRRDANGRAKVAAPSAADDIARKDTIDTHAALTGAHGATPSATADRLMLRDADGRVEIAAAASPGQAVNLGQFASLLGAPGYIRLPGGLILQWVSGAVTPLVFPIAFPNACLTVALSAMRSGYASGDWPFVGGWSATGVMWSGSSTFTVNCFAVGY